MQALDDKTKILRTAAETAGPILGISVRNGIAQQFLFRCMRCVIQGSLLEAC